MCTVSSAMLRTIAVRPCMSVLALPSSPLHISTLRLKDNTRRLPVASSRAGPSVKATSRRESVAQVRAEASRARWEAERQHAERVRGLHPTCSVYFQSSFEQKQWPLADIVAMLRETAVPEVYDCLDNPLTARIYVNMRTKKTTKFLSKYEFPVRLPHPLTFLPKRRIIALCKDPDQIQACINTGAVAAGGTDIVTRIETGGFHWDEYDDVVAHPDFLDSLNRLRKVLRNRLPTVKNGRVGENLATLVTEQQESVLLTSSSIEGVPEVTQLMVTLGQLSWDIEKLNGNLMTYLQALEENKSSRTHGEVVEKIELECLPCDETLLLNPAPLLELIRSKLTAEKNTKSSHKDDESEEVTAAV
ncbi:hypothetical protein AAHC03_020889 [Spirometra sp. Aus1]